MSIFRNVISFFSRSSEKFNPLDPRFWNNTSGASTDAGVSVNEEKSLQVSAVFACVKVISDTVASLPFNVYQPNQDGKGRSKVIDHKLDKLFNKAPNKYMNAFDFKRLMQVHINLWGNFYAEIEYNGKNEVIGLHPIHPSRVNKVYIDEHTKIKKFEVSVNDKTYTFTQRKIFHVPGLSYDGIIGISVIKNFKENIGTSMAMEKFSSRFFGSGTHLGGVTEVPGKMSDEAYNRLTESMNREYKGIENSHKVIILEENAKFKPLGIPPEDAQFIEQRKFSREEICMIYQIPPHMISILDKATYNNLEHQNYYFAQFTITPRITNMETHINWRLLPPHSKYYVKFNIDGLLRGDSKARSEFYATARQWGWMSVNDIRELEDMEPVEGGDTYLSPLNMIDIKESGKSRTDVSPANSIVKEENNEDKK